MRGTLSLGLAASAAASKADFTSQVYSIIEMLEKTRDANTKALADWDDWYKKGKCWCEKADAAASVSLGGQIAEMNAKIAAGKQQVKDLQEQSNKEEMSVNAAIRDDQVARETANSDKSEGSAKVAELESYVEAAGQCVEVLQGSATALLQKGGKKIWKNLRRTANSSKLNPLQARALSGFLDAAESHRSLAFLEAPSSAYGIGEVVGICKQLKEDMQSQIEELKANGATSGAASKAKIEAIDLSLTKSERKLHQIKNDQIVLANKVGEMEAAVVALTHQQKSNSKAKAQTETTCASMATEYNESIGAIHSEQGDIGKAVEFLRDGMLKLASQGKGSAFVQVKAHKQSKSFIGGMKRFFSRLSGNSSSFLEVKNEAKKDGETTTSTYVTPKMVEPVVGLIDELIETQKAQSTAEAEDHRTCTDEIKNTNDAISASSERLADTKATMVLKGGQKEEQQAIQQQADARKEALDTEQASLTSSHEEEMAVLKDEIETKEGAFEFLSHALVALNRQLAFLDVDGNRSVTTFAGAGEDLGMEAVSDNSVHDAMNNLEKDTEHALSRLSGALKEKPDARQGVKGPTELLDKLKHDLEDDIRELKADQSTAQEEYTATLETLKAQIAAVVEASTGATAKQTALSQELDELKVSEEEEAATLKATQSRLNDLTYHCAPLLESFHARADHYERESNMAQKVKSLLNGMVGTSIEN